jgi:hypothetical protein
MRKLEDVTIQFVSFVKKGANKRKFFLTKDDEKKVNFETEVRTLFKKDDPMQLVYGIVYEPDVPDAHNDIMTADEIEKMAHEFLVNYRLIDKGHNRMPGAGEVVESYIAPDNFQIGKEIITKGSWVLVTKADNEVWQEIQNGEYSGYSMAGWAKNVEEIEQSEEKSKNIFKKIVKALGIKVDKDFDSELERMENNDIFHYIYILEMAIDSIVWNEEDGETKKQKIIESLNQLLKKVETMTFKIEKKEQGESEMTKEEFIKLLKEDEEFRNTVKEVIGKEAETPEEIPEIPETPEIPSEPESEPKPEPAEKSESEKLVEENKKLREDFAELQKSVTSLTKALLTPNSRNSENSETKLEKIGIRAKTL